MICFQLCCCLFETTYTFSGNSTAAFEAHSCFTTSQIKKAAAATNVHFSASSALIHLSSPHFLHTLVFSCSSSDEKVHSLCTIHKEVILKCDQRSFLNRKICNNFGRFQSIKNKSFDGPSVSSNIIRVPQLSNRR